MPIESYRDLLVWQKGMDLTVMLYNLSRRFPREEIYDLVSQLTRCAALVPANIAEGKARSSARDFAHFLAIARGSLVEAETYLLLAIRLGCITDIQACPAFDLASEVGKMRLSLRRKLLEEKPAASPIVSAPAS
ncbi:MAG: four helix bundle protein [Verrucomicrobiia bacterium]